MSKRHGIWLLAVMVLAHASTAAALSLGRARGAALLGRALDISVLTTLEAQEALPEASCFAADVFYGDTRISPNSVSVSPERMAGGESRLRIRSSVAIDEPVVTLYVRASCGSSVSRRYVLLADTVTDTEPPLLGTPAQVPRISPSPVTAPMARPTPSPMSSSSNAPFGSAGGQSASASDPEAFAAAQARALLRAEKRQALREQRAARAQERNAQREQALALDPKAGEGVPKLRSSIMRDSGPIKSGSPRLQVDLMDLASVSPSLRGSSELSSAPTTDTAVRSQALALWRSLSASPEDALKEAQRVDQLQAQMRTSVEQSKRQAQDIASLNTQLLAEQKARYINPFTIALGLLTLAALGACFWFWRRSSGLGMSTGTPWWKSSRTQAPKDEQHLWEHLGTASAPLSGSTQAELAQATSAKIAAPSTGANKDEIPPRFVSSSSRQLDFSPSSSPVGLPLAKAAPLGNSTPSGRSGSMGWVNNTPSPSFAPSNNSGAARNSGFGTTDFASSNFSGNRVVAAEELFDIQEQADFFMSLGQPDQAIEVLKNHITENVETSALAYMDLFDIYHRTGAKNDYSELREEFNRVFNAQVPDFESYGNKARGLEDYPAALKAIEQHWPGAQVLDVIEESIFRQPDALTQPFDMLAYRELMLLYSMAKELSKPGASFAQVQPITPLAPLASLPPLTASAFMQLDPILDSGQADLGMDLTFDDSPATQAAIRADATGKFPAYKPAAENLDFDLSNSSPLGELDPPRKLPAFKKKF